MFSATILQPLTNLDHLVELNLIYVEFPRFKMQNGFGHSFKADSPVLPILPSVKKLLIFLKDKNDFDTAQFLIQISTVFICLEELTLKCANEITDYDLLTPMNQRHIKSLIPSLVKYQAYSEMCPYFKKHYFGRHG